MRQKDEEEEQRGRMMLLGHDPMICFQTEKNTSLHCTDPRGDTSNPKTGRRISGESKSAKCENIKRLTDSKSRGRGLVVYPPVSSIAHALSHTLFLFLRKSFRLC